MKDLNILIPTYNDEKSISKLLSEINIEGENIENFKINIIIIDDGSIQNLQNNQFLGLNNISIFYLKLNKNYGHQMALYVGLLYCNQNNKENLIIMDGDLQHDPSDLLKMIDEYEKGTDMIIGWRKNRKDNFFSKKIPSYVANFIVRLFSKSKIHDHGCAFKIVKKNTIDDFTNWGDFHRLLAARLANSGYKVTEIEIKHNNRIHGKSNYGFGRILKVIIDLLFLKFFKNYKRQSIYFFGLFSFFSFLFAAAAFIYMIVLKYMYDTSFILTPLPLLIIFLLMIGLIFLFIGFLAQLIINQDKANNNDTIKEKILLKKNN